MDAARQGIMTVRGTINKFGFMLVLLIASAAFNWHLFQEGKPATTQTLMMVGVFGGLIMAFAIIFKPGWAKYIAPLYAILEGLFIGGISVLFNEMFAEKYPGLIMQAVGLTFGVAISVFLMYNFRVIRATERLCSTCLR